MHLEDLHEALGFDSLLCNNVETKDNEEILGEIYNFYNALYSHRETPNDLNKFLEKYPLNTKSGGGLHISNRTNYHEQKRGCN